MQITGSRGWWGRVGHNAAGFVFSAGSNMLTRVHLSIRGGDSGWEAGGTSCSMEGAQVGVVVVVMSGRQETLLASQQGPSAVFFGLEM